jgi:M6 family metalloprotease-like protein
MKSILQYFLWCCLLHRIKLLFCSFFFFVSFVGFSYNVVNKPITVTQPDQTVLHLFATGDGFYNRLHDENNYTIVTDSNGYYVYGAVVNGELVPTSFIVGITDPLALGLLPGLNYNAENIQKIRNKRGADKTHACFMESTKSATKPSMKLAAESRFAASTMNPIVIFVKLKGGPDFKTTDDEYNVDFNTGANSLRKYYEWNSYNKLSITSTTIGGAKGKALPVFYQDPHEIGYYQPKTADNTKGFIDGDESWARERTLWINAIDAMKGKVPADLNLDQDGNDTIDMIFFVVSGGATGTLPMWPHRGWLNDVKIKINNKIPLDFFMCFDDDHDPALLSHETGHVLGAPDMYCDGSDTTLKVIEAVGHWELMANQTGLQQSMSAYVKWKYMGFINDIPEIKESGTYTLSPLGDTPQAFKFASTKANEFFVVEYRKKTTSSFESQIPGSGLVIYRVNTAVGGNTAANHVYELYAYREGGIDNKTPGPANDPKDNRDSHAFFSIESGRTAFNDNTSPSPFLSDGSSGGLYLYDIGSAGNTISFSFKEHCLAAVNKLDLTISSVRSIPSVIEAKTITTLGGVEFFSHSNETFKASKTTFTTGFHADAGSNFHTITVAYDGCKIQPIPSVLRLASAIVASSEQDVLATEESRASMNELKIYPNPSDGIIHFERIASHNSAGQLDVYNSTGNLIYHQDYLAPNTNTLELIGHPAGMYYLKIVSEEGVQSLPFIIK